ncbi:hypothetical protein IKA92_07430 [bacterium]|nr:hypothetical protein [bacterium]MBR2387108.1 hypothetical protein [bacterium]
MAGNIDNLVQNQDRTPEQRRESAKKAGLASGNARRERREIQKALQKRLNGKYEIGEEDNKQTLGGYDAIAEAMIVRAVNGDVKAATFIRDTIGEKPVETVSLESDEMTGIEISFVNKSNKNTKKEKDPKIVGEFTPPSNTEEE